MLPLPAATVSDIIQRLRTVKFKQLYGAFEGKILRKMPMKLCAVQVKNIFPASNKPAVYSPTMLRKVKMDRTYKSRPSQKYSLSH